MIEVETIVVASSGAAAGFGLITETNLGDEIFLVSLLA